MALSKTEHVWERTNVTNLLRNRQSGNYYARVKVNGKQKWRLRTKVFSVAKLRLSDAEKQVRAQGLAARGEIEAGGGRETSVAHFVAGYLERTRNGSSLAKGTKERRESAIKALLP